MLKTGRKTKAATVFFVIYFMVLSHFFDFRPLIPYLGASSGLFILLMLLGIMFRSGKFAQVFQLTGKKYPIVFLSFVIISAIPCYIYRFQPLFVTLTASWSYCSVLLFYFLYVYNVNSTALMKIVVFLAAIWTIIFFVQQFTYPSYIFGRAFLEDKGGGFRERGGIICFTMSDAYGLAMLAFAYYAEKFSKNKSAFNTIMMVIFFGGVYLTQSRLLMGSTFLGFMYCMLVAGNKKKYGKWQLNFLIFLCIICLLYFNFDLLFHDMKEQTEEDSEWFVRFESYAVYGTYWAGPMTFLFGNGIPAGDSAYSKEIQEWVDLWITRDDIGIMGAMNTFGLIFVLVFIRYLFRIYQNRNYIDKYLLTYALMTTICLPLGFPIFNHLVRTMIFTVYMYLVEKSIDNNKNKVILQS